MRGRARWTYPLLVLALLWLPVPVRAAAPGSGLAFLDFLVSPDGQAAHGAFGVAPASPQERRVQGLPPDEARIPEGPVGDMIRFGLDIVTQTRRHAGAYVGASLNCTSCHLDRGRQAHAAPWVGLWGAFPAYQGRSGSVILLEDRINDCFRRSLNGKPLPWDSLEMRSLLAYIRWLSTGATIGAEPIGRGFQSFAAPAPPDEARGRAAFATHCASCHGSDGQGHLTPDGGYLYPPLWGPMSFNIGAGMARLDTAAAFIRSNMPPGHGGELSDQEAFDIAAYFTRQARPDFADKVLDWPRGGKPADARY